MGKIKFIFLSTFVYMRLLLAHCLILMVFPVLGQQNDTYPDLYSAYFNNLALVNPAFVPEEGRVELLATYKNRTGPFRKIATYSFTGGRFFRKENESVHAARIIFWNEREGPYIQKPRAYANYAYQLPLSEKISLSAGLAVGFAQVAFSAPSATGTGSAILPDGALGLMLKGKKLSVGVSSLQVFDSGAEAIQATVRLRRHYNLFLSAEKNLSPALAIKGYVLGRYLPSANHNADVALEFAIKEAFSFGCSAKYRQGLAFFASFNINTGKDRLLLNFAYNSPLLSKNNTLLNSMEVTLGYVIN